MQLDDEVPLSGDLVTVACGTEGCGNRGVEFDVAVEIPALCGPCGVDLYRPGS